MDIGIYLHIPFCISKCYYCDFTSYAHGQGMYEEYVNALVKEITAHHLEINEEVTIKTIFIGGGTPSVLPPILLEKIMKHLNESFHIAQDVEYTMESNPGTLSVDQLKVMKDQGVNRISMGVQAYQNHLLKRIGRAHTQADFISTYHLCRDLGFDNINLDLMFGLPGQTLKEWQETLGQVVRLGPDHISAYSLIIEEDTPFGDLYNKGQLEPLDDELERLMYHDCIDYLNDKGYKQYEISNFAKEGKASQHNIDCWQCRPYIGMGLGAHSYFKGHRYNNTYIIKDYIKDSARVDQIQEGKEVIDLKAQIEEYMFLGLRLTNGIEIEDFKQRFNQSLWDLYGVQINQHKDQGLLAEKDGRIFLTSFGQDVSNIVFSSFL